MQLAKLVRIATVAIALSATGLASAPPAAAQSFHFGYGNRLPTRVCLSEYQLRKAIARQGYSNIYLNVANNNRIQIKASKGKWVYLLTVNSCTGRILDRDRYQRR